MASGIALRAMKLWFPLLDYMFHRCYSLLQQWYTRKLVKIVLVHIRRDALSVDRKGALAGTSVTGRKRVHAKHHPQIFLVVTVVTLVVLNLAA